VRKLVIVLVVLVGLGVTADFGAAAAAEYQVAKQMREELGLATDPSVRINGFPFLSQAVLGSYSAIDMRAAGLTVGPLHDVAVEATLRDVDAPLSDLRSGDLQSVRVAEAAGRVRISDRDIGRSGSRISSSSRPPMRRSRSCCRRVRGPVNPAPTAARSSGWWRPQISPGTAPRSSASG
jgi:LmeA-like phospholipid-binding